MPPLATGAVRYYLSGGDTIEVSYSQMNQPIFRLAGFVVLAAIVLATGFGALG